MVELTRYYLVSEGGYTEAATIPVLDTHGNILTTVDPYFFAALSLEGSGKLNDGRILNVSGNYAPAPASVSQSLKSIADQMYRSHYGYVGLSNDCQQYFTYTVSPTLWGVGIHNKSLTPFVSVATDQSVYPFGTVLFASALVGMKMPDGTTHNGYLHADDTGGAIVGAHCDWFVAYKSWELDGTVSDSIDVEVYSSPTS
jgi:3D (Asp-Asp-Asp) domain-containing protein